MSQEPKDAEQLHDEGCALVQEERFEEALGLFEQAVALKERGGAGGKVDWENVSECYGAALSMGIMTA